MNSKICLVTGATNGIGKETALGLAKLGATVIVVGRNRDLGAATVAEIKQNTGNNNVESMTADLSSMAEVRRLAKEFKAKYNALHVLINNAGAIFLSRQLSPDGIEMTFALNHLSYFLLTNLLLDLIKASAPARIVNVSSDAHEGAQINFDDLQGAKGYTGLGAYGQSKLANIMFTYELARRLSGTGVTANVLHPGFVRSRFAHNNGPIVSAAMSIIHRVAAISVEQGADTSIYLASSPEVEGVTGKYFVKKKAVKSNAESYAEAAQARLWQISEEMVRIKVSA